MHHLILRSFVIFSLVGLSTLTVGHQTAQMFFDIRQDIVSQGLEIVLAISVFFFLIAAFWRAHRTEKKLRQANQALTKLSQEQVKSIAKLSSNCESLAKAQRIAHLGSWDWNIQTGEMTWSDELCRIIGRQSGGQNATYEAFLACVHLDDRDRVVNAMRHAVDDHKPFFIDHRLVRPDGTIQYVHEQGEVEVDDAGEPSHMSGTVLDVGGYIEREDEIHQLNAHLMARVEQKTAQLTEEISVRIAAQKDSQDQRAKAERYLAMAGTMLVALDTQGRIEMINDIGAELLGYDTPQDLIGKDWFETAIPDKTRSVVRDVFHDIVSERQDVITDYENDIVTRTGRSYLMKWHNTFVRDDQGQVIGILGSATDITAQKHHEASLIDAKNAAEEASRSKDGFLSNMSQELRTPMNAVLGFAQLLQSNTQNLTKTQIDYIAIILKSGDHLMSLINQILDLSRIEIGVLQVDLQDLDLLDALGSATTMITTMAKKYNINIHVEDDIENLPLITADKTRLRQVLVNLLSNAIKYNHESGDVFVSANHAAQDMLRITIRDTGLGIPAGQHHELFKPFNRLSAENSGIEGTGVGLVLTQNLIQLMNGKIGFDSAEGLGSTFWIELPIAHTNEYQPEKTATLPALQNSTKAHHQILCVEDDPTAIRLLEGIVNQTDGLDLMCTPDVTKALEMSKSSPPDVVILNIKQPCGEESGLQAWCHLQTPPIPIIAICECHGIRDTKGCNLQNYTACIDTPLKTNEVLNTLRQALNLPMPIPGPIPGPMQVPGPASIMPFPTTKQPHSL
ncbi:MAG: PAS domain-containing protein [Magnetovibrio sp.]|nr:PAS domain-containing protein [Magnetovibrio sp.]